MTVTMDNHRTCHTPCWTVQNTKPFTSWIVSRIIYNTCASNVIKIDFISIRHPGLPRSFSSPRNWSHKSLSLVVQVLVVWWKHDLGWWMGVVVCLRVNRSAKIHSDRSWHGLYNPPPSRCRSYSGGLRTISSRYDINPQVPSIFIDHIPETGRISMTFAQLFQDKLTQLRPTTTNFIPSADVNA